MNRKERRRLDKMGVAVSEVAEIAQTDLTSAMVNGALAGFVYWWANERYKKNTGV